MSDVLLRAELLFPDNPVVIRELENVASRFDPERLWVTQNGQPTRLSDRVWQAGQEARRNIDAILRQSLASGEDALKTARKLEAYLDPSLAPVRDARGRLVRNSKTNRRREIVTSTPGRGGRGSYSARRLARTEIARAHSEAQQEAAELNPFVDELKYHVSNNHPEVDECDDRARGGPNGDGTYPIRDCPIPPRHPHCRCFTTPHTRRKVDDVIRELRIQYGFETAPVDQPATGQIVPTFKSVSEARVWLKENVADSVVAGSQSLEAVQSLANGMGQMLTPNKTKVRTIDFSSTGRRSNAMGIYRHFGDGSPGDICFAATKTKSARAMQKVADDTKRVFDSQRSKEIARMEAAIKDPLRTQIITQNRQKLDKLNATSRWASYQDAPDPMAAIAAHEAAHAVYFINSLESTWEAAVGGLSGAEWGGVSDYGATKPSELFAEAMTLRLYDMPLSEAISGALDSVLELIK